MFQTGQEVIHNKYGPGVIVLNVLSKKGETGFYSYDYGRFMHVKENDLKEVRDAT